MADPAAASNGREPEAGGPPAAGLPAWARELVTQYESHASSQFILTGNVSDVRLVPSSPGAKPGDGEARPRLGTLTEFITAALLPRFDVIVHYDLGNGIRIEKGGEVFSQWPTFKATPSVPREPRAAVEFITAYLRYVANLRSLGQRAVQVAVFVKAAHLIAPAVRGSTDYNLSALAMHLREWGSEPLLTSHPLATFLLADNLSDLHPLITSAPRTTRLVVPLPDPGELERTLGAFAGQYPVALGEFSADLSRPAGALSGTTISAVESLLKTRQHLKQPIVDADLGELKKQIIERDAGGLIDFIKPDRTLDDLHGMEKVKQWLHQDIKLWRENDLAALPMGYLFCGPVGTGKTYMVECLAGSAGVPVVRLKNFRDRWVGSTEANLETIFRLLKALGRCIVFVDEADQALGKRQADSGDSGVGGRVYSMFAEEMSNTRNRGKVVWVLASSRPDLIEVDLKRPGRIDVKIPLLPTLRTAESWGLMRSLMKRRGLIVDAQAPAALAEKVPLRLTPGAAEVLAVKVYRLVRTRSLGVEDAIAECLDDYQPPVAPEVMQFQIDIAVREASDLDFVPEELRPAAIKS